MKPFLHTSSGSVAGILRLQSFPHSQVQWWPQPPATEPKAEPPLLHVEQAYHTFLRSNLELVLTTTAIILMSCSLQPTDIPHRSPGSKALQPRELQWLNFFRFLLALSESSIVAISLLLTLTALHCHSNKSHICNLINNKIHTILSGLL